MSPSQEGKRQPVASNATLATGIASRLFVLDFNTGEQFLIDTGSSISTLPVRSKIPRDSSAIAAFAANGTRIATHGLHVQRIDLGLRRDFSWSFTLADIPHPILGIDFLKHFSLSINIPRGLLVDDTTGLTTKCRWLSTSCFGISTIDNSSPIAPLLAEFPVITRSSPVGPVLHNVRHFIETRGPPVHARSRRLAPDRMRVAKEAIDYSLQQGILRQSNSPWASPLHMVNQHGKWRMTVDYRRLNAITKDDRYPVPRLHDFSSNLAGCQVFSKIDLVKGFHQIPVAAEDVEKTAVITPFGLFEYLRMPFGLKNAPQTFQRFMNSILGDLSFVFVYIDDILIASSTQEDHQRHLREVFSRLADNGLSINTEKCEFIRPELIFLGHRVTSNGLIPIKEKIEAVQNFPQPTSKRQLRRFLGLVGFYRSFHKGIAPVLQPLYDLLSGKSKDITWTPEAEQAFVSTKTAIAETTLLHYHQADAPLSVQTDASDKAIGAVLQQQVNGKWQPLAFFSRALKPPQQRYSTFDRELLAVVKAIKFFQYMLEGRPFTVFTDHRPLTTALSAGTEKSPRQSRHLEFISQFTSDIQYVKGNENAAADALSRFNVDAIENHQAPWSLEELANEQKKDAELKSLRSSPALKSFRILPGSPIIIANTTRSQIRPFVPSSLRRKLFNLYHNLSHPGVRGTRKLITERYFWPSATADIKNWVDTCMSCQTSKVHRHTIIAPAQIDMPSKRFSHVHLDIVGPLPPSQGNKYLLTMVDRFTRWPEAVPLPSIEAETVANAFVDHWISRFGTPDTVTTDQGRQFESRLFRQFCSRLGTQLITTSAYNPRANGMVERFHRQLKSSLKALNTEPNWTAQLPLVMLGIRATTKEDLKLSSAELVYADKLRLPADLTIDEAGAPASDPVEFAKLIKSRVDSFQPTLSRPVISKTSIPADLEHCSHVLVTNNATKGPLDRPKQGPFLVLKRNKHTFSIQTESGPRDVNIQHLTPTKVDKRTVTFNIPRKVGRPRKHPLPDPSAPARPRGRPRKSPASD